MLQAIFGLLLGLPFLWGLAHGTGDQVAASVPAAAAEGVNAALGMAGGFAFFCGLMNILKSAGTLEKLSWRLQPGKGYPLPCRSCRP